MVVQLARMFGMFVWFIGMFVLFIGLPVAGLARLARSCRSLAGQLLFFLLIVVFVGFNGLSVWLACQGPGPPGYNVITGEMVFDALGRPGQFGPTWRNIRKGLEGGTGVALIGLAPFGAGEAGALGRREAMNTAPQGWRGRRTIMAWSPRSRTSKRRSRSPAATPQSLDEGQEVATYKTWGV